MQMNLHSLKEELERERERKSEQESKLDNKNVNLWRGKGISAVKIHNLRARAFSRKRKIRLKWKIENSVRVGKLFMLTKKKLLQLTLRTQIPLSLVYYYICCIIVVVNLFKAFTQSASHSFTHSFRQSQNTRAIKMQFA